MENSPDPLADLLRDDALLNRPVYSPDLHQLLMQEIHAAQRSKITLRWAVSTLAAAAMMTICAAIGVRMLRPSPIPFSKPQANAVDRIDDIQTEFQIKGMCSASLWPPAIRIDLPTVFPVAETTTKHPAMAVASEGLPQLLMGVMQQQIDGADSQIADEISPGLRRLFADRFGEKN